MELLAQKGSIQTLFVSQMNPIDLIIWQIHTQCSLLTAITSHLVSLCPTWRIMHTFTIYIYIYIIPYVLTICTPPLSSYRDSLQSSNMRWLVLAPARCRTDVFCRRISSLHIAKYKWERSKIYRHTSWQLIITICALCRWHITDGLMIMLEIYILKYCSTRVQK